MTTTVTLAWAEGLLIVCRIRSHEGTYCKRCLAIRWLQYQVRNIVLGVWGFFSILLVFIFFFWNIFHGTRGLLRILYVELQDGSRRRKVLERRSSRDAQAVLAPFRHTVRMRLERREDPQAIAASMAEIADVPEGPARDFVLGIDEELFPRAEAGSYRKKAK